MKKRVLSILLSTVLCLSSFTAVSMSTVSAATTNTSTIKLGNGGDYYAVKKSTKVKSLTLTEGSSQINLPALAGGRSEINGKYLTVRVWDNGDDTKRRISIDNFSEATDNVKCTYTVTYTNGNKDIFNVERKPEPQTVSLNSSTANLKIGQNYVLSECTNSGSYANAYTLKWATSNPNVATVHKQSGTGKAIVIAKGSGSAKITVTTYNGLTSSCNFKVTSATGIVGTHCKVGGNNKSKAPAYADSTSATINCYITSGSVFKIEESKNNRFRISYNGKTVWVSQQYALINAKEYTPSLIVQLDFASSNNKFNAGGKAVPGVSDTAYYKSSGSKNGTEVWLTYKFAQKVNKAQQSMRSDDYAIKIYDGYRPYDVTTAIYPKLKAFLNNNPSIYNNSNYYNSTYPIQMFLAPGVSYHNSGVAVDITLVDLKTNKELSMPTQMHTLDARSGYYTWYNNDSATTHHAKYLRNKMVNAGCDTLSSEWWHFQDSAQGTNYNFSI